MIARPPQGPRALLLDRDGVVNVDKGYVHRIADVEFIPGIFELCRTARELGYLLVIVTNQAGIGRGLYTEADFQAVTEWMDRRFAEEDAPITRVYHCPYHPEHGTGHYRRDAFCRKPNPGMLLQAREELGLDLGTSILVGDKLSDIEAGRRAGVGTNVLLRPEGAEAPPGPRIDHVFPSPAGLRAWLIEHQAVPP